MKEKLSKLGQHSVLAFAIVGVVSIVLTVVRIVWAKKDESEFGVELESEEEHADNANE